MAEYPARETQGKGEGVYEVRCVIDDEEAALCRVDLATRLASKGIDPRQPYLQRHDPHMQVHFYVQRWHLTSDGVRHYVTVER